MKSRHERNHAVMSALRKRHEGSEWAFFEEVPDGTGAQSRRRADGLAMNLWPSRGLELHGYEVKVDKVDWRNESSNPEKAEALGRFCDRWWLVIDDLKIIEGHDVPLVWGILVATDGKIRTHREASKLDAQPLTRSMVASLLRRAADARDEGLKKMIRPEDVEAEVKRRVEIDANGIRREVDPTNLRHRLKQLEEWGEKIHAATGIRPGAEWHLPNLKLAVKAFERADPGGDLERQAEMVSEIAKAMKKTAKQLRESPLFNDATRCTHNSATPLETVLAVDTSAIHIDGGDSERSF
jgi:hypothetical protein